MNNFTIMIRCMWMIGLVALLGQTGCNSESHGQENEHGHEHGHGAKAEYPVTHPVKKDTAIRREYVCQIHGRRHIEVRSLEKGYLKKIYVNEGQHVKEGQLMFKILPQIYNAELQKAEAEANAAKIEYQNTKRLADSNIVSPNELAIAKAEYENAKAELELAQAHLNFTNIKAPFDGIMNRLEMRKGSYIEEGELLTTLTDNSEMWVYFNVPEREYLNFKTHIYNDTLLNKKVKLLMANDKIYQHPGKVKVIGADFNNETGNIAFRANFPNPEGLLRHGETGNILVDMPVEDAIIIPQKATHEILTNKYVYVVDESNQVHLRQIKIGATLPDLYVVKNGLSENDKILLEGIRQVKDDEKIKSHYVQPDSAMKNLKVYAE